IDDRDLWLLELRMSADQRHRLADAIAATEGRNYPYTFFVHNCAWYLQELLARAGFGFPAPSGPTSPTGVWSVVANSDLAGTTLFRSATSYRVARRFEAVDDEVVRRIEQERWEDVVADTAWLVRLGREELAAVNEYA